MAIENIRPSELGKFVSVSLEANTKDLEKGSLSYIGQVLKNFSSMVTTKLHRLTYAVFNDFGSGQWIDSTTVFNKLMNNVKELQKEIAEIKAGDNNPVLKERIKDIKGLCAEMKTVCGLLKQNKKLAATVDSLVTELQHLEKSVERKEKQKIKSGYETPEEEFFFKPSGGEEDGVETGPFLVETKEGQKAEDKKSEEFVRAKGPERRLPTKFQKKLQKNETEKLDQPKTAKGEASPTKVHTKEKPNVSKTTQADVPQAKAPIEGEPAKKVKTLNRVREAIVPSEQDRLSEAKGKKLKEIILSTLYYGVDDVEMELSKEDNKLLEGIQKKEAAKIDQNDILDTIRLVRLGFQKLNRPTPKHIEALITGLQNLENVSKTAKADVHTEGER